MIDYKNSIAELISNQLSELNLDEIKGMIEVPQDSNMGDYAFPCFKLAKIFRKDPQDIAKELAEKLQGEVLFQKVEQVNAYVNMFLSKESFSSDTISGILNAGDDYGTADIGKGKTVIVEYSSPNIAKPFHIGHIRTTVIGNSLYKIFDYLGYNVVRINHLGDYGTQFGKMIVAYRHWGS